MEVQHKAQPYTPSDDYVRSVQCRHPQTMQFKDLDPSLALGFYIRNEKDFTDLQVRRGAGSRQPMAPPKVLISIRSPQRLDGVCFNPFRALTALVVVLAGADQCPHQAAVVQGPAVSLHHRAGTAQLRGHGQRRLHDQRAR